MFLSCVLQAPDGSDSLDCPDPQLELVEYEHMCRKVVMINEGQALSLASALATETVFEGRHLG